MKRRGREGNQEGDRGGDEQRRREEKRRWGVGDKQRGRLRKR